MKEALLLNAVDPRIGGVLISGEKGTAKSTSVRALADVLPRKNDEDTMMLVDLPLGSTEDRVAGTLDTEHAVKTGEIKFEPGILSKADGNVLYVDEINLLDDRIVDLLLGASASGMNRVERDGISYSHPSRFVLVGTMNPEEGDLRPQFAERFGMCVNVESETDEKRRMEIVTRRMRFEKDPDSFRSEFEEEQEKLRKRIVDARGILTDNALGEDILRSAVKIVSHLGIEGCRADIALVRAAYAYAAFRGKRVPVPEDVLYVSRLVVPHRLKIDPFGEEKDPMVDLEAWFAEI